MEGLEIAISTAMSDWKDCNFWSSDEMNQYLTRHESTFLSFGAFVRGMRVKPVATDALQSEFHHTLDGMRGVISMNIAILRVKKSQFIPQ